MRPIKRELGDVQRASIKCAECGYELLVKDNLVFCQNCRRRVIPK